MKQNQYLGNKTGWWYGPLWGSRKVTWIIMDFTSHLWLCDCFYLVLCTKCDTLSITNDFVVVFLMNFVPCDTLCITYDLLVVFLQYLCTKCDTLSITNDFVVVFLMNFVQSVILYVSLMTLWFVSFGMMYKVWYSIHHLWLCGMFSFGMMYKVWYLMYRIDISHIPHSSGYIWCYSWVTFASLPQCTRTMTPLSNPVLVFKNPELVLNTTELSV